MKTTEQCNLSYTIVLSPAANGPREITITLYQYQRDAGVLITEAELQAMQDGVNAYYDKLGIPRGEGS